MRRFVQAFSAGSGFRAPLPPGVGENFAELPERYNISIGQPAGVLFIQEGHWMVAPMRWGLVPSWEPAPTTRYSTQTARLERAPRSRMFRSAWAARRCVVPMNGYYKWDRLSSPRQPYFIQAGSGELLHAAALWSLWGDEQGENLLSFSILTHPNSAIPDPLVPDGPIFLAPDRFGAWISAAPDSAASLLRCEAQPPLEAYPVSRRVANRKLDDYSLLEPTDPLADGASNPQDEDLEDDD